MIINTELYFEIFLIIIIINKKNQMNELSINESV